LPPLLLPQKEFLKVSRLTGVGFLAVGLIGFIVKVIFIPINQVGAPTHACMLILLGWARGAPYQPAMVNRPASWVWCDETGTAQFCFC
jgi:hypothetical protein